jgi:iron(III) transport system substrate-binding protein
MRDRKVSKRDMLKASTVLAAGTVLPEPLLAATAESTAISPAMIAAAKKEAMVTFYTAMEILVAEKLGRAFEAKHPGIAVRVKRSGAERLFQRVGEEEEIHFYEVDVVCSTDASHFIRWKRDSLLAAYLPEDVTKYFPPEQVDADGMYATAFALLSPIGYNTSMVNPEDAPKSFADLLDPRWKGRIVKARPDYSGTILTATFQIARDLGWSYFEKLARRMSSRWNRRSIHLRESRLVRARCRPMAPFRTCYCSRSRVPRSSRSMRARAHRWSPRLVLFSRARPIPMRPACSRVSCSAWRRSSS